MTRGLKLYILGYILCIGFTLTAYFVVVKQLFHPLETIVGLVILQSFVQLIFFLHLGKESKPRWNLHVFLFMVLVLIIIVFGSLWIMSNLNYNLMS